LKDYFFVVPKVTS